jgi:hypothetical protein
VRRSVGLSLGGGSAERVIERTEAPSCYHLLCSCEEQMRRWVENRAAFVLRWVRSASRSGRWCTHSYHTYLMCKLCCRCSWMARNCVPSSGFFGWNQRLRVSIHRPLGEQRASLLPQRRGQPSSRGIEREARTARRYKSPLAYACRAWRRRARCPSERRHRGWRVARRRQVWAGPAAGSYASNPH